jgi:phosphopentomutase
LGAIEEIKSKKPRVLFVSLGETDDWAHSGRYDLYLLTTQQNDRFLAELWTTTQSIEQYRDKTLFIVTTDHGRGDGREGWKNHSILLTGSERIWIAAWGVPLKSTGIDRGGKFTQSQVAATVAAALGYDFKSSNPKIATPLPVIEEAILKP